MKYLKAMSRFKFWISKAKTSLILRLYEAFHSVIIRCSSEKLAVDTRGSMELLQVEIESVSIHFFWCLLWCCNHGFLFKTTIKLELFKVKFFSSKTSKIFLIKWWFFKYCPVLHFSHLPTARQLFRYWRATQWISLLTVTSCHRIQIPCIIKNAILISETFSI